MAKVYAAGAPDGETMARADGQPDLFLFDPLGYARVTPLMPNGCRLKTLSACLCMRQCAICLLDEVLPSIPEPAVVQPINEAWDAAKEIDEAITGICICLDSSPLETLGGYIDAAFKVCLLFPCCPEKSAMTLMFEGQKEHGLKKPVGAEEIALGPKLNVTETLFITDERTCCQRFCGCKKGSWTIYKDEIKMATVRKKKKMCQCASYYGMYDMNGTPIARIQVSPTCSQIMNNTCRKCTCQCCCLCRICDCLRCKCMIKRPIAKIMAPTTKELLSVYSGAKCCKAPKTKVMYRTLYIPGQDGGGEEDAPDTTEAEDVADNAGMEDPDNASGSKDFEKYNKQTKGANKGQPGQKYKYYQKKPPYFCVGLCRDVKRGLAIPDMEELDNLALAVDTATQMAHVAGAQDAGKARLKNYKCMKDERADMQFGEAFTTSQKAGALLYMLWELKKHQF